MFQYFLVTNFNFSQVLLFFCCGSAPRRVTILYSPYMPDSCDQHISAVVTSTTLLLLLLLQQGKSKLRLLPRRQDRWHTLFRIVQKEKANIWCLQLGCYFLTWPPETLLPAVINMILIKENISSRAGIVQTLFFYFLFSLAVSFDNLFHPRECFSSVTSLPMFVAVSRASILDIWLDYDEENTLKEEKGRVGLWRRCDQDKKKQIWGRKEKRKEKSGHMINWTVLH